MKKAIVLLVLTLTLKASAGVITLNDATAGGFTYTVEWGSTLTPFFDSLTLPSGLTVLAFDYPWVQQQDPINTVETLGVRFNFPGNPPDTLFTAATITIDRHGAGAIPSLIASTADGYGAVITFGDPSSEPAAMPDGGPGVALALGVFGLVMASRQMPKRRADKNA